MQRVCVLGDSHAACIKRAWDARRDRFRNFDLTFFAARREGLKGLKVDKNLLIPSNDELLAAIRFTSGGHEHLDLSLFDHVLIVGLFPLNPTIRQCKSLEIAAKIAVLQLRPTIGHQTVLKIRRIKPSMPIWVIHRPLQALEHATYDEIGENSYVHLVRHINEDFMSPMGCFMFEQPAATIVNTFYTKPEFSVGSHRLDIGDNQILEHKVGDDVHMNAQFGHLCLEQSLPKIASHAPAQTETR